MLSCSDESIDQDDEFAKVEKAISEEVTHELKDEQVDFADFYYIFSATIESKNYEMFNGFIHPNYGCYVIESSGAMPNLTPVFDVGEFVSKPEGKRFFDLPFVEIDHIVSFDSLPKVVCEDKVYERLGCFAGQPEDFKRSEIWNYAGLSQEDVVEVVSLVESLNITVVNTYNYTFHFSKIESEWFVSFIDMRVPCSA